MKRKPKTTSSVYRLSVLLHDLKEEFGIDEHKIHLLGIVGTLYKDNDKDAVKVTSLIEMYDGTSRATTHKAIKDMVEKDLLRLEGSNKDGRVRWVYPGKNFARLEKLL